VTKKIDCDKWKISFDKSPNKDILVPCYIRGIDNLNMVTDNVRTDTDSLNS